MIKYESNKDNNGTSSDSNQKPRKKGEVIYDPDKVLLADVTGNVNMTAEREAAPKLPTGVLATATITALLILNPSLSNGNFILITL